LKKHAWIIAVNKWGALQDKADEMSVLLFAHGVVQNGLQFR
jgi:hypothetical protein